MTDLAKIVERYDELKVVLRKLAVALRKRVSDRALAETGKKLMARHSRTSNFPHPDIRRIALEHAVFQAGQGGKTVVDRYLSTSAPAPGSDDRLLLEAMLKPHYSIFGVDEIHDGVGATAKDLLQHDILLIADEGLALQKAPQFAMAGRILRFDHFAVTTGAMLLLTQEVVAEVGEPMAELLKGRGEKQVADLSNDEKHELEILLSRSCLVMEDVTLMDTDLWSPGEDSA